MAKPNSPATQYIKQLCEENPDAPALRLAKLAYSKYPERWPNLEACRTCVRKRFGVHGSRIRKDTSDKHLYREPRKAGWTDVIPQQTVQLPGWEPEIIEGQQRILLLSDVHFPFHDAQALEVALEYGEKLRPTIILLNGDIADHYSISRWIKDPAMRDFPGEIKAVKFFLAGLRKRFGRYVRLIYKIGNHEERYDVFMRQQCPELLGVLEFKWENVFGLEANKVEMISQKRPIRFGKLNVIHGHEYKFNISNPVNPARGFFLRAKTHVIGGHLHQSSNHSEKTLDQKIVTTWSTGCLCGLHPEYAPLNNFNHGFAWIEIDKDGGHHVENLKIINGKVWPA